MLPLATGLEPAVEQTVPVEPVADRVLCSHELMQQQQGLHCHTERRCVDHLEQGIRVLLYEGLHVLCGHKWESSAHAGNDGAEDAGIYFFGLHTHQTDTLAHHTLETCWR